jgi:hypothetical protein
VLSLTDPRWPTLLSGRRTPYDARKAIRALEQGSAVWEELWDELHHQGDVDTAAYAAVPHLVRIAATGERDWNLYALAATIEVERHRKGNPAVPTWAVDAYSSAWQTLQALALVDLANTNEPLLLRSALSVVALARRDTKLGALLSHFDTSEIDDLAEDLLAWSELYA